VKVIESPESLLSDADDRLGANLRLIGQMAMMMAPTASNA
jgi:hypothetical protein